MLIDTTPDAELTVQQRIQRQARNRWHAVIVVGPANACAAAQACKGKRFLSSEAPRLPLKGCDSARCECRYRHYNDRRGEPRRGDERTGGARPRVSAERRSTRARRATDV